MVNWQVTATTIYCDSLGGEVTIMIYKDGQVKCTGSSEQPANDKRTETACAAEACSRVIQYKQKLMAEEKSG